MSNRKSKHKILTKELKKIDKSIDDFIAKIDLHSIITENLAECFIKNYNNPFKYIADKIYEMNSMPSREDLNQLDLKIIENEILIKSLREQLSSKINGSVDDSEDSLEDCVKDNEQMVAVKSENSKKIVENRKDDFMRYLMLSKKFAE